MSSKGGVVKVPRNVDTSGHMFLFHQERKDDLEERFQLAYMGVADETVTDGFEYKGHQHTNHELIFVTEGTYFATLNNEDKEVAVNAGDLFIVEPGNIHAERCAPPLQYYVLWFRLRLTDARGKMDQISMLKKNLDTVQHSFKVNMDFFKSRLDEMIKKEEQNTHLSVLLQKTIAKELFWTLIEELPQESLNPLLVDSSSEAEFKHMLFYFFEDNYSRKIGVTEMAEHMQMSESSFAHKCSDILGVSPAKAFFDYRLQTARKFLLGTTLNINEIARRTGFNDSSHFINSFKKATGQTPKQFRRENATG